MSRSARSVASRPGSAATRSLRTAIVVMLGAAVVLVATWASVVDHDPVVRGVPTQESDTAEPPAQSEPPPAEPREGDGGPADERPEVPALVATIVQAVILLLVCAAAVLTVVALVERLRRRGRRREDRGDLLGDSTDFADPIDAATTAVVDDATEQLQVLERGTARNGIVEAWHRFELQAERGGVRRQPWETASELTLRVLDLVGADAGAVGRLADLYREARFSDHEVTETHREAARQALLDLHAHLGSLHRAGRP